MGIQSLQFLLAPLPWWGKLWRSPLLERALFSNILSAPGSEHGPLPVNW